MIGTTMRPSCMAFSNATAFSFRRQLQGCFCPEAEKVFGNAEEVQIGMQVFSGRFRMSCGGHCIHNAEKLRTFLYIDRQGILLPENVAGESDSAARLVLCSNFDYDRSSASIKPQYFFSVNGLCPYQQKKSAPPFCSSSVPLFCFIAFRAASMRLTACRWTVP